MSRYEADPAGLGVGKRYGPLSLGGTAGVTQAASGEGRVVFEISLEELAVTPVLSWEIPENYALITGAFVEVEEAFGAGDTLDVEIDATTILAAPLAVSALGIVEGTLAGSTQIDAGQVLTVNTTLVDAGGVEGFAKVVVTFERV